MDTFTIKIVLIGGNSVTVEEAPASQVDSILQSIAQNEFTCLNRTSAEKFMVNRNHVIMISAYPNPTKF